MKYGLLLMILGLAQIALTFNTPVALSWLLDWSALSWILAGAAYLGLGSRVFGKRSDGSMNRWNVVLLFPYLVVTWLLWLLQTRLTKEPPHNEIVSGLWLGRRCSARELPVGIGLIVDLTSEFGEPVQVKKGRRYICAPTLDASVPFLDEFDRLVQESADFSGPIYVHCALGHGRSATAVVAILVARGAATSLAEAERMVKAARPGIEIKPPQRALLERWWRSRLTASK